MANKWVKEKKFKTDHYYVWKNRHEHCFYYILNDNLTIFCDADKEQFGKCPVSHLFTDGKYWNKIEKEDIPKDIIDIIMKEKF